MLAESKPRIELEHAFYAVGGLHCFPLVNIIRQRISETGGALINEDCG